MRLPDGWTQAYAGAVHTWNAFSSGEPIVLEMKLTRRDCAGDRVQLFFAFPQAKRNHAVWDSLRKVRDASTCG